MELLSGGGLLTATMGYLAIHFCSTGFIGGNSESELTTAKEF